LEKHRAAAVNADTETRIRWEQARLTALEGKTRGIVARLKTPIDAEEIAKGRKLLDQAQGELNDIAGRLKKEPADAEEARLEQGVTLLDLAVSHGVSDKVDDVRRAAELTTEARKVFAELAAKDGPVRARSLAWLVCCHQEIDEPAAARKYFLQVQASKEPEGQRLGRAFYIRGLRHDPAIKTNAAGRRELIAKEATSWLRDYPAARQSWLGQSVRLELARARYVRSASTESPKGERPYIEAKKEPERLLDTDYGPEGAATLQGAERPKIALDPTTGPEMRKLLVPGSLHARSGAAREYLLKAGGGTTESEAAITRGLRWIVSKQQNDGRWSLDTQAAANDVAGTAFGLLPLLGSGFTHRAGPRNPYDKAVDKGLLFLVRKQNKITGDFGGGMYAHGLATITLCEAYALTQDSQLRRPAQLAVNYIVKAQHSGGGWRYGP